MSDPADGKSQQTPEDPPPLLPAPVPTFAAGDTVPGLSSWVLERKLGGGGFGAVWLARHAWNAREKPRAVKFCTDPAARHRLVTHEQNVVRRVMKYAGDHPNIVPLLECNLDGDIPWLMYEFVEGGTLASLIGQWRELPPADRVGNAVRALHGIACGLAACHRLDPPLVHRDMKPQNVLMAGSVPRITDFGIGSVVMHSQDDATGALTAYAAKLPSALQSAGTRKYAPPEQMAGSEPNPRDDVYALGVIAYQMAVGDPTATPGADAALELRDLQVPDELVALIVSSVAARPERRPKDATEWETTLAALVGKMKPLPDTEGGSEIGSRPVLLSETTAGPSAPTGTPAIPSPHGSETQPDTAPAPANSARSGHFWALAIGGSLLGLCLAVAAVYVLTSLTGPRSTSPPTGGDPGHVGNTPPTSKDGGTDGGPDPKVVPNPPTLTKTCEIEITTGVKMKFCWIPAGECQLGSPKAEQDAVRKDFGLGSTDWLKGESEESWKKFQTEGFWMGKYEVTQGEWIAVMGNNPSYWDGKNMNAVKGTNTLRLPVDSVLPEMINGKDGFLDKVRDHEGIRKAFGKPGLVRLPQESEWEYACRGGRGNKHPYYWGDALNGTQANMRGNTPFGTPTPGQNLDRPCAVDYTNDGKYEPHPWGLMHMHGNVWEWCLDTEDINRYFRRGGSFFDCGRDCRAAYRVSHSPPSAQIGIGFRLVFFVLP